jgi:hypothetical protein
MRVSIHWLLDALVLGHCGGQPLSLVRAQEEDEEPDYSVRLDLATTARLGIERRAV